MTTNCTPATCDRCEVFNGQVIGGVTIRMRRQHCGGCDRMLCRWCLATHADKF